MVTTRENRYGRWPLVAVVLGLGLVFSGGPVMAATIESSTPIPWRVP